MSEQNSPANSLSRASDDADERAAKLLRSRDFVREVLASLGDTPSDATIDRIAAQVASALPPYIKTSAAATGSQWADCFRYTVGWTDIDDEDWHGLMWDGWLSPSLAESIRRAESLSRANPEWRFVVYDAHPDVDDCVPYELRRRLESNGNAP